MIRKIFINRLLIFQTICILSKYKLFRVLLSSKELLKLISEKENIETVYHSPEQAKQPFQSYIKSINRILHYLYPDGNCLVKSLVKRDLLQKYGFTKQIAVGVIISGQKMKAHAWLSGECESNFKIVHLL